MLELASHMTLGATALPSTREDTGKLGNGKYTDELVQNSFEEQRMDA